MFQEWNGIKEQTLKTGMIGIEDLRFLRKPAVISYSIALYRNAGSLLICK